LDEYPKTVSTKINLLDDIRHFSQIIYDVASKLSLYI